MTVVAGVDEGVRERVADCDARVVIDMDGDWDAREVTEADGVVDGALVRDLEGDWDATLEEEGELEREGCDDREVDEVAEAEGDWEATEEAAGMAVSPETQAASAFDHNCVTTYVFPSPNVTGDVPKHESATSSNVVEYHPNGQPYEVASPTPGSVIVSDSSCDAVANKLLRGELLPHRPLQGLLALWSGNTA